MLCSCRYHLAVRVPILPAGADGCPRVLRALPRWSSETLGWDWLVWSWIKLYFTP